MPASNKRAALSWWPILLLALVMRAGLTQSAAEPGFESAADVSEGALRFLETPPTKPVHHHHNTFRIDENSLDSGWVHLSQCHQNLDAVPRTQITFREGFVRDLKLVSFSGIESARTEGASVHLVNVEPGAKLCLSALTRALRPAGKGYYNVHSGPYMRKFLDGYYPMRVTLEMEYPPGLLSLIKLSPPGQPGLEWEEKPGFVRMDAVFEGELNTLIQFKAR